MESYVALAVALMLNMCNFCTCYVPLQFGRLINVVDMSDNNRSVNSEQMRNLRLRQPHAVVLHANVQAGLAVCRLVMIISPLSIETKIRISLKYRKSVEAIILQPPKYNSLSLTQK